MRAELTSRSAEIDQARHDAAQAAERAQHSAAQAAEELAQTQRGLDECQEELLRSRAAAQRAERELEMCQAGLKQSSEAQHSVREELARSREALGQCRKDLVQSEAAAERGSRCGEGLGGGQRSLANCCRQVPGQTAAELPCNACRTTSVFTHYIAFHTPCRF